MQFAYNWIINEIVSILFQYNILSKKHTNLSLQIDPPGCVWPLSKITLHVGKSLFSPQSSMPIRGAVIGVCRVFRPPFTGLGKERESNPGSRWFVSCSSEKPGEKHLKRGQKYLSTVLQFTRKSNIASRKKKKRLSGSGQIYKEICCNGPIPLSGTSSFHRMQLLFRMFLVHRDDFTCAMFQMFVQ